MLAQAFIWFPEERTNPRRIGRRDHDQRGKVRRGAETESEIRLRVDGEIDVVRCTSHPFRARDQRRNRRDSLVQKVSCGLLALRREGVASCGWPQPSPLDHEKRRARQGNLETDQRTDGPTDNGCCVIAAPY
jgi:hypothetical protein